MKHPCKPDCPKRSADCHSICPDYRDYEKARNAEYEKKAAERAVDDAFYDGKQRLKLKNYKRNREWRRS